jgi:DNA-binding NarL/FixJ family response regulator
MSIGVLLAEDAVVMRLAIRRLLQMEPNIDLLGEAVNFQQTIQMAAHLKPKVVLLDLHMPGERQFSPAFIKSELLLSARHVLMMSLWTDADAKALAESYGAIALLDKSKLAFELVPAILRLA